MLDKMKKEANIKLTIPQLKWPYSLLERGMAILRGLRKREVNKENGKR